MLVKASGDSSLDYSEVGWAELLSYTYNQLRNLFNVEGTRKGGRLQKVWQLDTGLIPAKANRTAPRLNVFEWSSTQIVKDIFYSRFVRVLRKDLAKSVACHTAWQNPAPPRWREAPLTLTIGTFSPIIEEVVEGGFRISCAT